MGYTRSVSQLKSATRCGEDFRLSRLVKVPQRPAPWTALGVAFHEAFYEWELLERKIDVCDYFQIQYDTYITQMKLEQPDLRYWMTPPNAKSVEKTIDSYRTRGLEKDVPTYRDRCLKAGWEVLSIGGNPALELPFELDLDGVQIRGKIDSLKVFPQDDYVFVEDLKTGNVGDDEADRRQLGVYALAAKEVYGVEVQAGRYWFTKVDRPSEWFDLSRYTREYLGSTFRRLDAMIDGGMLLASPGAACGLCSSKPWCGELGWIPEGEGMFEDTHTED